MGSQDLVSIIVPVYNVEKRISRCIESILNQSYENFELILVIDGSPDNSLQICTQYAEQDGRITIINQTNQGAGAARNAGLAAASGKYVSFVDADDMLLPNHLSTLVNTMSNGDCDIVWSNYIEVGLDGGERVVSHGFKDMVLDSELFCQTFLDGVSGIGALWNKIYSLSFIRSNNVSFETDRVNAEDWHFNLSLCLAGARVRTIKNATYKYVRDNNSITNTFRPNDWIYKIRTYERVCSIDLNIDRSGYNQRSLTELMLQIILCAVNGYDYMRVVDGLLNRSYCRNLIQCGSSAGMTKITSVLLHLVKGGHRLLIRLYISIIVILYKTKKFISK